MEYAMTRKISESKSALDFINVVSQFCLLLESNKDNNGLQLLQNAYVLLCQLCLYGMKLPEIKRLTEYETHRKPNTRWKEMFDSLNQRLEEFGYYHEISDPFDLEDHELILGSLSNDLSEIYQDIAPGLHVWEKANTSEKLCIIWEWKWGYENHWGDHATTALRALHSLLFQHIEN